MVDIPTILAHEDGAKECSELRLIATRLLWLYDWRKEVGGAITDSEARWYGHVKKLEWERLREVLKK